MGPAVGIYLLLTGVLTAAAIATITALVVGAASLLARSLFLARHRKARWVSSPIIFGLASCVFLLTFCGLIISPFVSIMIPRNPAKEDLIGVWVPTEWSLKLMKEADYKFSAHAFEFSEDGTFVMTNMPDAWVNRTDEPKGWLYSGRGIWEVTSSKSDWKVKIHFTSMSPDALDGAFQFDWAQDLGLLYFYLGDGKAVSFEKCGKPGVKMSNETMKPFVSALDRVDSASLGFTPIPSNARVEIEGTIGVTDVMLHIYADTSRTIAFKWESNSYKWIFEQEIHEGPERWTDHDGAVWRETVTVQYQTDPLNGIPTNKIVIDYTGHDPRLSRQSPFGLTLKDVAPILEEWRRWRLQQPPSPVSLCS